ncbi:sodium:calcium antiporter [Aidingimonas halophila]|uniref:Cation:H+ antiporter n=1 Tax=Aidingimonas halophila TaxID=574349 RepID=A0A1H3EWR2_9GAMM|nr:hypothetical protein [Aidingimonas halophila]GHC31863.1 hypothetical protein GCM10008094_25650 [Aidingimonas halophila]SDX83065.1 cation:H+ antiporter [Aidingimonas halophila]
MTSVPFVVGLVFLIIGAEALVRGASRLAGAIRGERDIAVGNVVGSNVFNIMGVLGLASLLAPSGVDVSAAVIRFDIPVMIAVALACLPVFFTGGVIGRGEGALLLGYYVAYTAYLILATAHHDALPTFSAALMYGVIPLTAVFLTIAAWCEWRSLGG